MKRIIEAIELAASAHQEQKRKVSKIPYISHPLAVGMILQELNCSEDVIIAGILHDSIEDTQLRFNEIEDKFGSNVAKLVLGVTEDKSIPEWEIRKKNYIENLQHEPLEILMISAADKYHNLFALSKDKQLQGEDIWKNFKRGKKEQFWYYRSLLEEYGKRSELKDTSLLQEIKRLMKEVFGETAY